MGVFTTIFIDGSKRFDKTYWATNYNMGYVKFHPMGAMYSVPKAALEAVKRDPFIKTLSVGNFIYHGAESTKIINGKIYNNQDLDINELENIGVQFDKSKVTKYKVNQPFLAVFNPASKLIEALKVNGVLKITTTTGNSVGLTSVYAPPAKSASTDFLDDVLNAGKNFDINTLLNAGNSNADNSKKDKAATKVNASTKPKKKVNNKTKFIEEKAAKDFLQVVPQKSNGTMQVKQPLIADKREAKPQVYQNNTGKVNSKPPLIDKYEALALGFLFLGARAVYKRIKKNKN